MHWVTRMRWRQLASITVLRPGDILQTMGSKEIMVETGHTFTLVLRKMEGRRKGRMRKTGAAERERERESGRGGGGGGGPAEASREGVRAEV
jgi:hypothetical protein